MFSPEIGQECLCTRRKPRQHDTARFAEYGGGTACFRGVLFPNTVQKASLRGAGVVVFAAAIFED